LITELNLKIYDEKLEYWEPPSTKYSIKILPIVVPGASIPQIKKYQTPPLKN
jgi:hypothetical protein